MLAYARENGFPWALCKGLDTMCPIGKLIPKSDMPNAADIELEFQVSRGRPLLSQSACYSREPVKVDLTNPRSTARQTNMDSSSRVSTQRPRC